MWVQETNPFGNIGLSALVASIPILILFYALAIKRMKGHIAGAITLASAIAVAIVAYGMPVKLALLSTLYGVLTGLFPIGWIVLCAVFLYNLTVKTGYFGIIKDSIASITEDRRLQALLIGYCFGAFLEGAAGFGAPVAITAGMLVGLGFQPLYAAGLCLIANTAPVAFGGIGIPIITAGKVSNLDPMVVSQMIANQLPLLSFIVPFWLVFIMSGWKGTKEVFPAVFVTAASFSLTMWFVAAKIGPELPNILSALISIVVLVAFLKVWKPKNIWRFPNEPAASMEVKKHPIGRVIQAWTPFIVLTILIGDWGISGIKHMLDKLTVKIPIAGLHKAIIVGDKPLEVVYKFNWLGAAGTAILLATIISALILRIRPGTYVSVFGETLNNLKFPLTTIACVLGFAYIANFAGITPTLGKALTVTGSFFPFVSPFLGWLGVFVTGSDTSANALFCNMQRITAEQIDVNPVLTVTANTSGGVAGKMISPQSIAVACASVNLVGKESDLFRFTVKHSLIFTAIMGIVVYAQAYYLRGMVPEMVEAHAAAAAATAPDSGFSLVALAVSVLIMVGLGIVAARQARSYRD
ncbi:lactate permease LctP family transporter [Desulfotomaculum varum]